MFIARFKKWSRFRQEVFEGHARLASRQRELFWFRGHGDAGWPLKTTLDRWADQRKLFTSDDEREQMAGALLREFELQCIGLGTRIEFPTGPALELLARHHGLPTALLDWTLSPYVAAFFAFEEASKGQSKFVAVYALHRERLAAQEAIQFMSERELLWFNRRALEQAGVFLRVRTGQTSMEDLLGDALTKMEIAKTEAAVALADLEAMGITARNLFRDFDGAARTAAARVKR